MNVLKVMLLPLLCAAAPARETQICKWKDDRKAAFTLMFDDNPPSHLKNVIPELKKRDLSATFYVCPGKKPFFTAAWEKEVPAAGMEFGNHTMTHSGARDADHLEEELKGVNDVLARILPDRKKPRLISFGRPGVPAGAWKVSDEQLKEALIRNNLVDRGPGNPIAAVHTKTGADLIAVVDKALAAGGSGYIIFHGVGGDWISTPLPDFTALLDALVERRNRVWVADHISVHQYETERTTAEVKTLRQDDQQIRLALSCKADPKLYDQPLTLTSDVPAAWPRCEVTQGSRKSIVAVSNGHARYDAVPGPDEILLRRSAP